MILTPDPLTPHTLEDEGILRIQVPIVNSMSPLFPAIALPPRRLAIRLLEPLQGINAVLACIRLRLTTPLFLFDPHLHH